MNLPTKLVDLNALKQQNKKIENPFIHWHQLQSNAIKCRGAKNQSTAHSQLV